MTTSSAKSDNQWQRVVHRVTTSGATSDNECQRVTIPANFTFFSNKRGAYYYPVDTGRKLNVRKTFRRCPGRLLNVVLCTLNSSPVSTGNVALKMMSSYRAPSGV